MDNESASAPEPIESSLCDVCKGLFKVENGRSSVVKKSEFYAYTYVHHAHMVALLESADAGCCLCKLLIDQLKKEEEFWKWERKTVSRSVQPDSITPTSQPDEDVSIATQLAEIGRRISQGTNVNFEADVHGNERIYIKIDFQRRPRRLWWEDHSPRGSSCVYAFNTGLWAAFDWFRTPYDAIDPNLEHRPSMVLLSEPHIALINRWRHTCKTEHESCNKNALTQPLPSRVLELLDPNDKERGIRLIETHHRLQGTYACLSYCWGNSNNQIGRTTGHNLEKQLQGISFYNLPNTVIDAIRLCHKLGFRFLWVDRLCIVQDDEQDWSQEAARMCEVYSRSALTISVPICKESSQSFLAKRHKGFRPQSQFYSVTHQEAESKCKSSVWFCDEWARLARLRSHGPWFLEEDWNEFSRRPYNLDDHWLDRGWTFQEWMLSPRVLHIESMTLWDCFDGYANEVNRRYMEKPRLLRNLLELGEAVSWDFLVEEYSKRRITRDEDKLPALAGLVTRYAQATGHTYLAGLWREDLPRWLYWEPRYYSLYGERRAPSWSWASLNEAVYFTIDPERFTATASILSFFCQYKPPGSFATVEKAWIDVEGRVSTVRAKSYYGDCVFVGDYKRWNARSDDGDMLPDDLIDQGNVCLLLLGFKSDDEDDFWQHYALMLQECGEEDGRQCYQRLGVAYSFDFEEGPQEVETSWETRVVRLV